MTKKLVTTGKLIDVKLTIRTIRRKFSIATFNTQSGCAKKWPSLFLSELRQTSTKFINF